MIRSDLDRVLDVIDLLAMLPGIEARRIVKARGLSAAAGLVRLRHLAETVRRARAARG